jgi:hypothetical protein
MKTNQCALCLEKSKLRESHIIPAFAIRWLKETSATGYLRKGSTPNRRCQDIEKPRLLCHECEQKFGCWENAFFRSIFKPFQQNRQQWHFEYDEWLLKFAQSLAWRALYLEKDELAQKLPNLRDALTATSEKWRRILLGEEGIEDSSQHHILFLDIIDAETTLQLPDRFNAYLMRSVDHAIAASPTQAFAYIKLPGIIFCSGIMPPAPQGWSNTEIKEHGILSPPQKTAQQSFMDFLLSRLDEVDFNIGENQMNKIAKSIKEDPKRLEQSESLRVWLADSSRANRSEDL